MTVELTPSVVEQLRELAERQGRDIRIIVEEALRDYLDAAAITDLEETSEISEAQLAMMGELRDISSRSPEATDGSLQRFDESRERIRKHTARFTEEEIAADVAAARQDLAD